jgi:hypothetical protein
MPAANESLKTIRAGEIAHIETSSRMGAAEIFARSTPRSGNMNLARFFKAGSVATIDTPSRQRRLNIARFPLNRR